MTSHEQYREDLALYAAGALTPSESEEMKLHLAECSECGEELRALNDAAAQIGLAVEPAKPRPQLRGQILARLEIQLPQVARPRAETAPVIQFRPRKRWFWAPAFAAAVLAFAFVALWRQDRRILGENRDLTAELATNNLSLQQAREVINTLTTPDAQHATLIATGAKPQPEAKTSYSPAQRNLVLIASNLAPLAPNKVYELWLLPTNGAAPVPAGTFTPDVRGGATLLISQFGDGASAKAFAVTIENAPGASTPTLPIVLSGTT